jgi:hypothetical protein
MQLLHRVGVEQLYVRMIGVFVDQQTLIDNVDFKVTNSQLPSRNRVYPEGLSKDNPATRNIHETARTLLGRYSFEIDYRDLGSGPVQTQKFPWQSREFKYQPGLQCP